MFKLKFWYTDLTQDDGVSWFATHLYVGTKNNGNPRLEIDQCFQSLTLWRLRLALKALVMVISL